VNKRMNLRRVRWLLKAGEFPVGASAVLLEGVLDMLADTMPGVLGACFVELGEGALPQAGEEAEGCRTEREEALGL
jgi:hypothetical protein